MFTQDQIKQFRDDPDWITVILGHYKRGYNLQAQLEAIKAQTIQPKEIIIVQNGDYFNVDGLPNVWYTLIKASNNMWVRFRFTVALLTKTKYVCMFDDDTIPWKKWLENCLNESKKQRWLYWTIWLRYGLTKNKENYYSHRRRWRANPNEETTRVDIIGHCWFFEREMLTEAYFREPLNPEYRMCWEDMHFSYAIQKYMWLNTYVPPHPKEDLEMRWSQKGWELGTKDASFSVHWRWEWDVYDQYHKYLISKGFKFVIDEWK